MKLVLVMGYLETQL